MGESSTPSTVSARLRGGLGVGGATMGTMMMMVTGDCCRGLVGLMRAAAAAQSRGNM